MIYVLYVIHVLVSLFLVLVVLLQQGKGADLSVFGGGATQAAFGARGSVNVLHRLTVACFVLFILTTLSIGLMQARGNPSVMRGVEVEESTGAPAPPAPVPAEGAAPGDAGDASAEDSAEAAPSEQPAEGEPVSEPPPGDPPADSPDLEQPPGDGNG
ncbi:MAG TPA: preprotein translocase subunit SecG [Thermoanaerobaculia bacterium]|nr:preprotein translocase subunit SecG [Thermoanaerobaculia bacterium]